MQKNRDKFAWGVKIGEKGQFVIPKQAREMFDIHPSDTILVLADRKRGIAIPPKDMLKGLAEKVFREPSEEDGEDAE